MPSLIRIAGSLARLPGGALVTDANGAPCCCGPTVPPPPAVCCVCRTGQAGLVSPGVWGNDACAGPVGCCIGRAFRATFIGKIITARFAGLPPPEHQWASVLDASCVVELHPKANQPPGGPCEYEKQVIQQAASMAGSYTHIGPPQTTQEHQVSTSDWLNPGVGPPIPSIGSGAAGVEDWALPSPRVVWGFLAAATDLLYPQLASLFGGPGSTAAVGLYPYVSPIVGPVPCDGPGRQTWQIGCSGACTFPYPGTPFTVTVNWEYTQACKRTTIEIFAQETEAYTGPGGGNQAEHGSTFTGELTIQTLEPCQPVAGGPGGPPGGGDQPTDPRVTAVAPWGGGGCCG